MSYLSFKNSNFVYSILSSQLSMSKVTDIIGVVVGIIGWPVPWWR
jgi:hypothetical protein